MCVTVWMEVRCDCVEYRLLNGKPQRKNRQFMFSIFFDIDVFCDKYFKGVVQPKDIIILVAYSGCAGFFLQFLVNLCEIVVFCLVIRVM